MKTEEKTQDGNREVFNRVVREALADGIITTEERDLIYDSGKRIGLGEQEIDALLNDLKKPGTVKAQPSINIRQADLIHSRRLIEKKKLPDGRIQEMWEHIDEELRRNTRPDARPGTMLKVRTTKKIRKTYKVQTQSSTSMMYPYIKTITDINYAQVKKTVAVIAGFSPIVNTVLPLIDYLDKVSDDYKKSKSPDRDTDFLIEIGKSSLMTSLPLIERYVPFGGIIGSALRFILTY